MIKPKTVCGVLIASFWFAGNGFSAPEVDISVDTEDLNSIAIGDNANASIQIGGLPRSDEGKCAKISIRHGKLTKIAIGKEADASIHLPENQDTCEED